MTKQELRENIKVSIGLMQAEQKAAASESVCRQIIGTPEWQNAGAVFLYAALPDELDLGPLIQNALQCGKRVYLPVVEGNDLLLRRFEHRHATRVGKYGIVEPAAACPSLGSPEELDLAIIPGRAFTAEGLRLGRGRGYYDRILPSLRCPRWGVAFKCQLVAELPVDSWDVRLDRVIAE